jgi:hypothetical protein
VPGLADANSTVGVAKESHPFRSASPTEKCNKTSSVVFDGLFDWTNGEPTYTADSLSMVVYYSPDTIPVRRVSY